MDRQSGPLPTGYLDTPTDGQVVREPLIVAGWVAGPPGVERAVEVRVDDRPVRVRVDTGPRPHVPLDGAAGFRAIVPMDLLANGPRRVSCVVKGGGGETPVAARAVTVDRTRTRLEVMRDGLDFARLVGLEIGPLATPMARKADGEVIYVDHVDTEHLLKKYGNDPGTDAAAICPVDAVWGDRTLAECIGGRKVDYVMASHVGEHVPDLVTWLHEIHAVLNPAGQLRLVLPDKRFSFDYLRDETRIADVLTAYLLRTRRPQVRDVLDFRLHYAPTMDGWGLYHGTSDPAALRPKHTFAEAMAAARRVLEEGVYDDVHCWVFAPRTFAALMEKLAGYGLLPFECAGFTDSSYPMFEFYVFLRPCGDPTRAAESWRAARDTLRDPLPGSAAARAAGGG